MATTYQWQRCPTERSVRHSPRPRPSRRGVLLLVVLSMLVLFMLIGTAFLMSSSQEQKTAKNLSKVSRVGNYATKELDRALLQILRDTENPYSVVRYHSLLRDLYGTDGLQGVIYSPPAGTDAKTADGQLTSFAGANPANAAVQFGPTNGQFIDIYVRELGWDTTKGSSVDDPFTTINEANPPTTLTQPDGRHVLRLDRTATGLPQMYPLPSTKGYFNGQLLTITSGAASGQSTRILDYDFISDIKPTVGTAGAAGYIPTRLFRFRVMAFQRSDGQALQQARRPPEIDELAGQSFMVNGRAFSGTGAGYNPLAVAGQPRLSALQLFPLDGTGGFKNATLGSVNYIGGELALLPNSVYYNPTSTSIATGVSLLPGVDPFTTALQPAQVQLLNNPGISRGPAAFYKYQSYPGPGDVNESYDAVDFQNMAMALLTVTPRAQGRVVQNEGGKPVTHSAVDPALVPANFLRLDLEDLPIPSFFRPDLSNFWFHRLLHYFRMRSSPLDKDLAVQAILDPYPNGVLRPGLNISDAALITAVKRQSSLRPLREDNPHFTGSNPLSVPTNLPTSALTLGTDPNLNIAIPYWEAVGPWDVDNDNDGIPDSVWVDLGDPVQEAEDGTRYKPLYALLIVDLDSRLNVNAHGLADEIVSALDDPTRNVYFDGTYGARGAATAGGNLAHDSSKATTFPYSTLNLARGIGYGPAEISLRPVFPAPNINPDTQSPANRDESAGPIDSYATLLFGRQKLDGSTVNGKYGFAPNLNYPRQSAGDAATAGSNYRYAKRRPNWFDDNGTTPDSPLWFTGEQASPSLLAQLKFFDYPWSSVQWSRNQSGYGTLPDLKGRYALGLDYFGQPVWEGFTDVNPNVTQQPFNLLAKSPYELDLGSTQRRDDSSTGTSSTIANGATQFTQTTETLNASQAVLGKNDDAAFSPTDLEKVLRAWDVDSGALPSRLWDSVDSFDPVKLIRFDPNDAATFANNLLDPVNHSIGLPANNKPASAELMAGAQQLASINRRLVTTDSYDLPVAASSMPNLAALTFGPDGQPGRAKAVGTADPTQTVGMANTDDFQAVMGKDPARATIVDLLQYRVWTEARRFEMRRRGLTEAGVTALTAGPTGTFQKFMDAITARVNLILVASPNLVSDLLAPEVIAGKRMDLNRPFGDGQDNNGDGVVDDPLEAGDPFLDLNGNGQYDAGEPYIDLFNKGSYQGPLDHPWSNLTANGTLGEPISFDYTNGHEEPLCVVLANQIKTLGGVRNLESQGRQLFARHLYCLMLLLVDENYIAPWNENDPQLVAWMDAEKAKFTATGVSPVVSPAEVDFIVKRKATCKMIAQWAVNCVDMRDPDVISTPFEFDENPWDGWGVWSDKWNSDVTSLALAMTTGDLNTKPSFIPFDGDPATDESKAEVIDWANVPANTAASGQPSNINQKKLTILKDNSSNPIVTHPLNQTRGLVWGAERPELLITETLAFHDRRTEDLPLPHGHGTIQRDAEAQNDTDHYRDNDLDQGLRPRGSAFVELYNPWSPSGQLPAEIYSHLDLSTNYQYNPNEARLGVNLDRLSNYAADANGRLTLKPTNAAQGIRRSPVWRMIVVEEWPNARSTGDAMEPKTFAELGQYLQQGRRDETMPAGLTGKPYTEPAAYAAVDGKLATWAATPVGPPPFVPSNPDFDPLFGNDTLQVPAQGQTMLYGSTFDPAKKRVDPNTNVFTVAYPNIEREFYFTTDHSTSSQNGFGRYDYDFLTDRTKLNLRIPDRTIRWDRTTLAWTQKFIPPTLEGFTPNPTNGSAIAPIMPGRYGVVGSAGTCYLADPGAKGARTDPTSPYFKDNQVYVTSIGRSVLPNKSNSDDASHESSVLNGLVRRIEMRPSAQLLTQPSNITGRIEVQNQQLLVASNGGNPNDETGPDVRLTRYNPYSHEIARENELISDRGKVKDIQSSNAGDTKLFTDATGVKSNARYYPPCVSIPVDGMSVSEPPWGYGPREKEAYKEEDALMKAKFPGQSPPTLNFIWSGDRKEGFYGTGMGKSATALSYDKPFDVDPVLVRTGTTANYRMIHLQRLANPLLPWNPEPLLADGKTANPEYSAGLPINPYLTVDSASVNLTAFNGTSDAEGNIDAAFPNDDFETKKATFRPWSDQNGDTAKYLSRSFDTHKQAWYFRSQERGAWARMNLLGSNPGANNPVTTLPQRVLWAQEPAMVSLFVPPVPAAGVRPSLQSLVGGRQMSLRFDEVPTQIATDQKIKSNYADMVLEHSLGFGNESMGLIYDAVGAKQPNFPTNQSKTTSQAPVGAAIGAPAASRFIFQHDPYDTTNRKLQWDQTPSAPNKAPLTVQSTDPWVHWGNRPFVSAEELLNVPMASQSTMLRQYSTINPNAQASTTPNPYGLAEVGTKYGTAPLNSVRFAVMQSSFGQMANMLASTVIPFPAPPAGAVLGIGGTDVARDATGAPNLLNNNVQPYGAPNFYRILDFVQVPSRYVGTDTMLNAETFNDVPGVNDSNNVAGTGVGSDIVSAADPRYNFQPPFNKVSRERDPGKVNLNTVIGRKIAATASTPAQIWSEVYDGIMHRDDVAPGTNGPIAFHDGNPSTMQLSEPGPAWRDVVLSRRGYVQFNADASVVDKPGPGIPPDVNQFGLNPYYPTMFANPFRSSDAGDLVPVPEMLKLGVDATFMRKHPYDRGIDPNTGIRQTWGPSPMNFGDARDAGFGANERVSADTATTPLTFGAVPNSDALQRDILPLFSEHRADAAIDTDRNPYMMYQPMSRLGNLVTDHSNVYAIWVTVGYFEVEKAPDWASNEGQIQQRLGGDGTATSTASIAAQALYNRIYPEGYMLGKEVGSDTGDVKRPRGFYIIDRSEAVGFRPGEDLNVEKLIRLRRRIE